MGYIICGNRLCILGRGYAIWKVVKQSLGRGYAICGNGLCNLWERDIKSVVMVYSICRNRLCNLWEQVM